MENLKYYDCFLETKEGIKHCFYSTTDKNEDVLNSIPEFNQGDYWSVDAGNNDEIQKTYKTDPTDNSFVLIPKTSVIKVWNEEPEVQPKKIY
jgi:hypothetical protein